MFDDISLLSLSSLANSVYSFSIGPAGGKVFVTSCFIELSMTLRKQHTSQQQPILLQLPCLYSVKHYKNNTKGSLDITTPPEESPDKTFCKANKKPINKLTKTNKRKEGESGQQIPVIHRLAKN